MNPNRMANHRRGEKAKLLAAVEELCTTLCRPICSADLRVYFCEHPDLRPCLLKRLGQQLIVAAEANDNVVPYLKKIGIFRHKAYYALEDTREWRQRFTDHCINFDVGELLGLGIPDHVETLLDCGMEDLATHAASGLVAEIELLMKGHSHPLTAQPDRALQFDFLRLLAKPFDATVAPGSAFISREEASRFLVNEAQPRRLWDAAFSPFRYLARFRWPQSALFPARLEYAALRAQLFHFVRAKWPLGDDDEAQHKAIAECLRYGAPPSATDRYLAG
jgi:hypothetical protein